MTKPINDKIAELYTDVFYFALSRVDNYRDAEDIAQTVMEKAISKTHIIIKNTTMMTSLTNEKYNMYFRKAKKINSILFNVEEVFDFTRELEFEIADLEKDILQHITGKLDKMNLCKAMSKLDDKYKTALQLCIVCDFSFVQASEILNINVNSVKTRYYRGLKSLKKEFLKLETGGVKFETEK